MLPAYLTSIYLQYKADTDRIATWLARTAKRCGFAVEADDEAGDDTGLSKKAQKKARQKAKKLRQKAEGEQAPSDGSKHTIAIRDFVPLARHIAGCERPPVQVPVSISKTLERAISLRKRVVEQFGGQEGAQEKASQGALKVDGHPHFIRVLESVREALTPRMAATDEKDAAGTTDPFQPLANSFATLLLEEPSESLQSTDGDVDVDVDAVHPENEAEQYQAEEVESLKEALLAFTCLLADLNRLQSFVQETWIGFQMGSVDLTAASIVSNTAMEMARQLEEDMESVFASWGGSEAMLRIFYFGQTLEMDAEDATHRARFPVEDLNWAMYPLSNTFYWPVYLILEAYTRVLEPGVVPMYRPGTYGVYDPSADRSQMSDRERFQEDKIILCEILPDFNILALGNRTLGASDEFTNGMVQMVKTQKISLWAIFAAQVFLDVQHILRGEVGSGYAQLSRVGSGIVQSLRATLEFHEESSLYIAGWPRGNNTSLRALIDEFEKHVEVDLINTIRLGLSPDRARQVEDHRLLKQHPIKCGLETYRFKVKFLELGIQMANAFGSILYTAQLYNALESEKLLEGRWTDMTLIETVQDPGTLYLGDRPRKAEDYLRRFTLLMGWSATNFARNKRQGRQPNRGGRRGRGARGGSGQGTQGSRANRGDQGDSGEVAGWVNRDDPTPRLAESAKGPRCLKMTPPVTLMFARRYGGHRDPMVTTNMSVDDIEKILIKSDWEMKSEGRSKVTPKGASARRRWTDSKQIDMLLLLQHLRTVLHEETLDFSVDYLQMHRICWAMLRQVKLEVGYRLKVMVGPGWLERESQLPFMIGYMFKAMSADSTLPSTIGLPPLLPGHVQPSRQLFESAARPVNSMLRSPNGGSAVSFHMEQIHGVEYSVDNNSHVNTEFSH